VLARAARLVKPGGRIAYITCSVLPEENDAAIEAWTQTRHRDDILSALDDARVPAGYPYTAADIANDPHYLAREMIQTVTRPDGRPLKVPGVLPKLSATPGRLGQGGPKLGAHTDDVLEELGIDAATRDKLRQAGII
jgi:crotonobetainyl-CoA:carnitine CoA-transferase CaiB-like acyl-CoA transferase